MLASWHMRHGHLADSDDKDRDNPGPYCFLEVMDMVMRRSAAGVLAVLVTVWALLLSPAATLQAAAYTTSDLYGTGSADEISILKVLDMALNKGGMSMSADTIKAYLQYWWSAVSEDLEQLKADVDTSVTTAQAFADYVAAAAADPTTADGLKMARTTVKFAAFCATMDCKTLGDLYDLLAQPGTFRAFLLSYVTDADGNIAGTVNNKLAAAGKYCMASELVNMAREAADAYIEECEGYYLVKTHTVDDVLTTDYSYKTHYDFVHNLVADIPDDVVIMVGIHAYDSRYRITDLSNVNFVCNGTPGADYIAINTYSDDWVQSPGVPSFFVNYKTDVLESTSYNFESRDDWPTWSIGSYWILYSYPYRTYAYQGWLYTSDGRSIRVYKSLDSFKAHTVGKDNIYYGSNYTSYDASVDNSYTFSGSYYNNTSYSHEVIQQQIDNSSEVNESTINNIVNNYITNNYGSGSGSGDGSGNGSGSGDGSWWDIGSGISAFVEGVAALLDFLLKLLGDLIGVISGFLVDLLAVMGQLVSVGDGFSGLLKALFGFLPDECIALIVSGVGLMVIVGVVKMIKG